MKTEFELKQSLYQKYFGKWFTPNAIDFILRSNIPETRKKIIIEELKNISEEKGKRIDLRYVYEFLNRFDKDAGFRQKTLKMG
jgi:hypothetical protein